ncbi:hypothetical protein ACF1RG_005000, partial [Enterobacter hormaechei]
MLLVRQPTRASRDYHLAALQAAHNANVVAAWLALELHFPAVHLLSGHVIYKHCGLSCFLTE